MSGTMINDFNIRSLITTLTNGVDYGRCFYTTKTRIYKVGSIVSKVFPMNILGLRSSGELMVKCVLHLYYLSYTSSESIASSIALSYLTRDILSSDYHMYVTKLC
jgi:hypothetical protein